MAWYAKLAGVTNIVVSEGAEANKPGGSHVRDGLLSIELVPSNILRRASTVG